ncbi:MAG: GNAT family N-acetyltransferase [Lachnospiraceae bacterium]|nr:GNAT family N-acetyltransferase [Lachnospiraceae bacterium]
MQVELREHWNDLLLMIPEEKRDIYYTEEYVRLYENEGSKALAVCCIEGGKVWIFPIMRRMWEEFYDYETAYGYGGAITNSDDPIWKMTADGKCADLLRENGFLCGLIRFHPLLQNEKDMRGNLDLRFERETVYIDLRPSIEDIWSKQITSKNRNIIRKADKNGLTYRVTEGCESLLVFSELYKETMTRLEADEFYFFDDKYYKKLLSNKGCFIALVEKDGRVLSAAIFMRYGSIGHYHLSGNTREGNSFGANSFLLWNTIKHFKQDGVEYFHLGGGSSNRTEDTLFRFKAAFSPYRGQYYIGKAIYLEKEYMRICEEWELKNPDKIDKYGNRVLKYRY